MEDQKFRTFKEMGEDTVKFEVNVPRRAFSHLKKLSDLNNATMDEFYGQFIMYNVLKNE